MTLAPPQFDQTTPAYRVFTIADVAVMPRGLPSGDVKYELNNGRLVTMAPPGFDHARKQNTIGTYLRIQAEEQGLGLACSEVGVILWRNPDRLVGPDAAFILTASLPVKLSPEGYLETIPEIVVEVRSKNDTRSEVEDKIEDYIRAGVKLIWIIDNKDDSIAAYESDGNVHIFRRGDNLTTPLLPGFEVSVENILS